LADTGEKQQMDISFPTSQFAKICKSWELYDEPTMGIAVKAIKGWVTMAVCTSSAY
jgi:poly(A) polymerase Pap1